MKRIYAKPTMSVERFMANMPIAEGCNTTQISQTTKYPQQTVQCIRTESETVFNELSGCQKIATNLVYMQGGYYEDDLAAIYAIRDGDTVGGSTGNYYLAPGWYLSWTSGRTPHAGPVTTENQAIFGFSF